MNREQKISALFSVLFACGEPISIERLCEVFDEKPEGVEKIVNGLKKRLEEQQLGVMLLTLENTYQLATDENYAEYIKKALDLRRRTPLSPAAFEVLSVVAYNQPVTKSFVEQVRGVDCSGVMTTLIEKGLIEERGRLELPGRPLLYGTTKNFLRTFGISDLSELPKLPNEDHTVNDVGEQLSIEGTEKLGEEE